MQALSPAAMAARTCMLPPNPLRQLLPNEAVNALPPQLPLTQVNGLDRLIGGAVMPQAAGQALLEDGHLGVERIVHCRQAGREKGSSSGGSQVR